MSHFKTFFILAVLLMARGAFASAKSCLEQYSKAQETCSAETYSSLRVVEHENTEEALAALSYILKTHDICFSSIDSCKRACRFESKNTTDTTDFRAFSLLLNCESGDVYRDFNEKVSHKTFATKIAHERRLEKPTNDRQGRISEVSTGMPNWPGSIR